MQVAYRLGTILSSAFTDGNIPLDIFHLCCASIGLDVESEEAAQRLLRGV